MPFRLDRSPGVRGGMGKVSGEEYVGGVWLGGWWWVGGGWVAVGDLVVVRLHIRTEVSIGVVASVELMAAH